MSLELRLDCGRKILDFSKRTYIMGILNVTPDSFSDGGQFIDPKKAVKHALQMVKDGADIIDIGGESTRPGADEVTLEEELNRTIPVIEAIRKQSDVLISIDTYKSEVARKALDAGADIVNDISGMTFDPKMKDLVVERKAPVILMHIQGTPKNMQKDPHYDNVVLEISNFLKKQASMLEEAGLPRDRIVIDPGIGFGKTIDHNLEIFRRLNEFPELGYPVLLGVSRKSMIGKILGGETNERMEGTAALTAVGVSKGVQIMRVHDVKEMARVCRMADAVMKGFSLLND